jgi:cytochrome c6
MSFQRLGQPKLEWSLKMKRIVLPVFTFATALAVVLTLSLSAHAQSAADLYKSKCAMCHGADGKGSSVGKTMGAHDFTTAEVQKMSDAELSEIITKGKNKMKAPTGLKPEDVKGLVAYIRTLKK